MVHGKQGMVAGISEMKEIFGVAKKAALEAGKIIGEGAEKGFRVMRKSELELVTEMDLATEKKVVEIVKESFPEHSIVAEESGESRGKGPVWVIDPIDGTHNFIRGVPFYSVAIAVREKWETKIGVVYDAFHKDLFTAVRGKGAEMNGKKIRVSKVKDFEEAFFATGFSYNTDEDFHRDLEAIFRVANRAKGLRRLGCASLDFCYLAAGKFDCFWEHGLKEWDIAAGALMVEEAGGKVTNLEGKKWVKSVNVAASNGLLHAEMLKRLGEVKK